MIRRKTVEQALANRLSRERVHTRFPRSPALSGHLQTLTALWHRPRCQVPVVCAGGQSLKAVFWRFFVAQEQERRTRSRKYIFPESYSFDLIRTAAAWMSLRFLVPVASDRKVRNTWVKVPVDPPSPESVTTPNPGQLPKAACFTVIGVDPRKATTIIRPLGVISTRSGAGSSLNSYPSSFMSTKGAPSPTQYPEPVRSTVPTCATACSSSVAPGSLMTLPISKLPRCSGFGRTDTDTVRWPR